MICDFRVGEEVICIAPEDELEFGKTYVVYAVFVTGFCTHEHERTSAIAKADEVLVNVNTSPEEKPANERGCPTDAGWYHWRFRRPIIDETPIHLTSKVDA